MVVREVYRSDFWMLSDMLWSGTFQNRQSTTGGISATTAIAAQPAGDVRFVILPIAVIARIQATAASAFLD